MPDAIAPTLQLVITTLDARKNLLDGDEII